MDADEAGRARLDPGELISRRAWVFDMDGTLTRAVHDFDVIRTALGLPAGQPILEALAAMPARRSAPLLRRLDRLELELAERATPAPGAEALLERLCGRGARLGVLTRNSVAVAEATLCRCRLDRYFASPCLIGRERAAPKPSPAGIERLLAMWGAPASESAIVGDFLFDLQAGRAAGVTTVYVDPSGSFPYASHADCLVSHLDQIP